jgi:hypothetical protein
MKSEDKVIDSRLDGEMSTTQKYDYYVLFFLIAIYIFPVWFFQFFPTQDGPEHLETALLLKKYFLGNSHIVNDYYELNKSFSPNILIHVILAMLMLIFPPLIAEKIAITFLIVMLPLAGSYLISKVAPKSKDLAILLFPFATSYFLHKGLYNFVLSLILYMYCLGYWLENSHRFTIKSAFVTFLLFTLTWFCHIFGIFMVCISIAAFSCTFLLCDIFARKKIRSILSSFYHSAIVPLICVTPAIILSVHFMAGRSAKHGSIDIYMAESDFPGALDKISRLLKFDALITFPPTDEYLALGMSLLFALTLITIIFYQKKQQINSLYIGILVLFFAYILVYWYMPDNFFRASLLNRRASVFPYFALILLFAAANAPVFFRRCIKAAIVCFSVLIIGFHSRVYQQANIYLQQFTAAQTAISDNSTLLPLVFSSHFQYDESGQRSVDYFKMIEIFKHAASYLVLKKDIIEFANDAGVSGHFPIMFKEEKNPYQRLGAVENVPPVVWFEQYAKNNQDFRVDYVLVWYIFDNHINNKYGQHIMNQIHNEYHLVYSSKQLATLAVYERNSMTIR